MFGGDARNQHAIAAVLSLPPTEDALAILPKNLDAATWVESVCGVHLLWLVFELRPSWLKRARPNSFGSSAPVRMTCTGQGDICAVGDAYN